MSQTIKKRIEELERRRPVTSGASAVQPDDFTSLWNSLKQYSPEVLQQLITDIDAAPIDADIRIPEVDGYGFPKSDLDTVLRQSLKLQLEIELHNRRMEVK
jgi:hypothetical protein